ncbi:Os11g0606300, partial [Oryza sativa Japonica Group]
PAGRVSSRDYWGGLTVPCRARRTGPSSVHHRDWTMPEGVRQGTRTSENNYFTFQIFRLIAFPNRLLG